MKYRCKICGEVFEVADGETPVCPLCGVGIENLEVVEEAAPASTSKFTNV